MQHRTWLTESRNLHSNVSTSQIRTVTLQQEHAVRVFLTDEYDVDNISNNITLPSTFTSKQGNHHIPLPPHPQLNVVFWVTNSLLASITFQINIA